MLSPASSRAADHRPATIPALREWTSRHGFFKLSRSPRILVPAAYRRRLGSTAGLLADELRLLTGRRARIVTISGPLRVGDVELSLGEHDRRLGAEGYMLTIGAAVHLKARTATGVFYGTRTLLQLLREGSRLPDGIARDWPRYPERGLMIDLGRRIYPSRWIASEIKELAYLKLNLLHLHLTDDQRWGIESDTHPEIVSQGALTKRELRGIVALGVRYHVTVVPEIDMPGHMGALLAKHPVLELRAATATQQQPTQESGKLDISKRGTLKIVQQLLDEYLPLFPGRYWDMGADEYLSPAAEPLYPQLEALARKRYGPRATTKDAIVGFVNWVDALVRRHGKTLRAWHDELGSGNAVRTSKDVVAEWWINTSPLSEPRPPTPQQLLAGGHRILNAGWFPTYYTQDVGPIQGKPDMRETYEAWTVNQFCGPTVAGKLIASCYVIRSTETRNLGATINAWDDRDLTLGQIAAGLFPRLRVLAQKTWNTPLLTPLYANFLKVMRAVGGAPGG